MAKNYYEILGVDKGSNESEIKSAYRKLAQEWHPDKHQGAEEDKQKEAEEKFKEISEAYAVLSDEEKRRNYDSTGSLEGNPFNFSTTGDPFDIASRFGFRFNQRPAEPMSRKGQSIRLGVEVSLADSLFGTNVPIRYKVLSGCSNCKGHGGTDFELCSGCNGTGMKTHHRPGMMMQQSCDECGGQAKKIKTVCSQCNGQRFIEEEKSLGIVIPAGIANGTHLRVAEKGGAGFNGGPPGDVLIEVRVRSPDLNKLSDEEKGTLRELLSK